MQLTHSASLLALIGLAVPAFAYRPTEALQLNFYRDSQCSQYIGEKDLLYPYFDADPSFPECFNFNQPSGTVSLNLAGAWLYDSDTPTPAWCTFHAGTGCTGEQALVAYDQGKPNCQPTRSPSGHYLWKSAQCHFGRN